MEQRPRSGTSSYCATSLVSKYLELGREAKDKKPSIGIHTENTAKSKHHSLGDRFFVLSPSPE